MIVHLNVLMIAFFYFIRIQDTGVRQVVEGPSGAKIKELNLTNCVRVSDVTLLRIAQRLVKQPIKSHQALHSLVSTTFYC